MKMSTGQTRKHGDSRLCEKCHPEQSEGSQMA